MKSVKTVLLSLVLLTFGIPTHATSFVNPIDSLEPQGWLKGGYGDNSRGHAVVPCDFYTSADLLLPVTSVTFRPKCPPNTNFRLETRIFDYINGDVKWYFADVPVGSNKNFTVSYQYQAYTYGAEAIARYKFSDGHYEYVTIGKMTQPPAMGMGYEPWIDAVHSFVVPTKATSFTIFFAQKTVPCDDVCVGPDQGTLSIANVVLSNDTNTDPNLIPNPSFEESLNPNHNSLTTPKFWFKGGWGKNTRQFYYYPREEDGTMVAGVEITSYTNGDAKWYFENVSVTPGIYTFTDSYSSSVPTELGVMYKTPSGNRYEYLATVPPSPSNVNWATFTKKIAVPADATSLTIFHSMARVGRLDLDNYSLTRD